MLTGRSVVTVAQACDTIDAVLAFDVYPESFQFRFATTDLPDGVPTSCATARAWTSTTRPTCPEEDVPAYLDGLNRPA